MKKWKDMGMRPVLAMSGGLRKESARKVRRAVCLSQLELDLLVFCMARFLESMKGAPQVVEPLCEDVRKLAERLGALSDEARYAD